MNRILIMSFFNVTGKAIILAAMDKRGNAPGSQGRCVMRIGFVPLIDAAPIIAAKEMGFFSNEGLNVSLHRQVGWANIRDKLSFGHLDAAHALLGMPLAS